MKQLLKKKKKTENANSFDFDFELEKIQGNLFSFIFSTLVSKSDAYDVLQETNLVICRKKKRI